MYGAKWIWQQSFEDKTFKEAKQCTHISQPSFSWTGHGCMVTECVQRELLQLKFLAVASYQFLLKKLCFCSKDFIGQP